MSISESMKEYYGMQVEKDMTMPIDLTLHDIKHIIEWYHTHTRTAGTMDCM